MYNINRISCNPLYIITSIAKDLTRNKGYNTVFGR